MASFWRQNRFDSGGVFIKWPPNLIFYRKKIWKHSYFSEIFWSCKSKNSFLETVSPLFFQSDRVQKEDFSPENTSKPWFWGIWFKNSSKNETESKNRFGVKNELWIAILSKTTTKNKKCGSSIEFSFKNDFLRSKSIF